MCWHKWPQWSVPKLYIMPGSQIDENGMAVCGYKQERTCLKCGLSQIRRLSA